uniref:MFS domain-containing protein n=1 Tax=Heterorhabditis bacteriophora TaxID=37862 RepID=A0A1I7XH11_HETBA
MFEYVLSIAYCESSSTSKGEMEQLVEFSGQILLTAAKQLDFDHVLAEVGDFGAYQIIFFFVICLPASLPSAFSAFNQPFVVGNPPHKCRVPHGREDLIPITTDKSILSCFQYNQSQVDSYRLFTSIPIDAYRDFISLVPCQMGWEYDNTTYIDSLVTELMRIARINGKRDIDVDDMLAVLKANQNSTEEEQKKGHNVTDLFKTENLRKKTIIVTYIWVMNAIIYNGLTLNVSNLPVDDYWSFIINGAVELPAYFIVWPLLNVVGRRWTLAATMIVCGIGCVSAMFMPKDYPWLVASASFIGKFGVGSGFAVIYIFAGELYPTVVRAIGMGMSSMVAGSGLLLAPHIVKLGDYMKILPLLIMGLMALSAGICTFFLPETLGAPLPMTIEDAENFGKKSKQGMFSGARNRKRESAPLLTPLPKRKAGSIVV